MNPQAGPQLRDIHLPLEPSWWPPAPGWWLLALLLVLALAWLLSRWLQGRRIARARRVLLRELDAACRLDGGAAQVAAMSELLRRAARRHAPQAVSLRDEAWLAFLDGDDPSRAFRDGPGRVLLDGPYRHDVDPDAAAALAALVRQRLPRFVTPADA